MSGHPSGDTSPALPEKRKPVIDAQFLQTLWDDLEIWRYHWRYQKYVENPAFAKSDAKAYTDLRNRAKQFYELPA